MIAFPTSAGVAVKQEGCGRSHSSTTAASAPQQNVVQTVHVIIRGGTDAGTEKTLL